jgi:hypothetical protein
MEEWRRMMQQSSRPNIKELLLGPGPRFELPILPQKVETPSAD